METAEEEGLNIAKAYRMKNKSESVFELMNKLLIVPNPPEPAKRSLAEVRRSMAQSKLGWVYHPPGLPVIDHLTCSSESFLSKDQAAAQEFLLRNDIDQALVHYKHVKPRTVQVLHTIGQIYAEKKGDYESAISYYKEAVRIQEQVKLMSKRRGGLLVQQHVKVLSFFTLLM